jgi:hypothetical protein
VIPGWAEIFLKLPLFPYRSVQTRPGRFFSIETIMDTDNDKDMMTSQAAPRVRKDHPAKKSSAQQKTTEGEGKNILYAVSEHSLCGFLEDEPDIYSVSDLKVRYR